MSWSPFQVRLLGALGHPALVLRGRAPRSGQRLEEVALPPRLRNGLERWVGGLWGDWPAPEGRPGDARFKRALWRRVRDWRRGA